MSRFLNYLWLILIAIYILSPFDAHPLFLDDLIAGAVLFYFIYRNARQRQQQQQYRDYYRQSGAGPDDRTHGNRTDSGGPLTLDEACRLLGVSPTAPMDEINRAYREKMSRTHPDKVSHLSEELQERARELTLQLNEAYDLIKRHKKA